MNSHLRSSRLGVLVAAAALATATSAASAAFSFNIVADNSTRDTTYTFPTFQTLTTNPGPLFTANALPSVTNVAGVVTLNFNAGLSAAFSSSATGIAVQQSTDGHLVLNVHFDTPISLTAVINESGIYSTTGNGAVNVAGGEVVIEALYPVPAESHAAALNATFNNGGWAATASTIPFTNTFTDYQIIVDNDLIATATSGSANIYKKTFTLQLIPGSGTPPTPEPATLSLLALAAPALLLRRRH